MIFIREQGFGGIYGVGKAAAHPPALAVLKYNPDGAKAINQSEQSSYLSIYESPSKKIISDSLAL